MNNNKRHICDVKNLRLVHNLPTSIWYSYPPFHKGLFLETSHLMNMYGILTYNWEGAAIFMNNNKTYLLC